MPLIFVRIHLYDWFKRTLIIVACISLPSCKVGPNFKPPSPPTSTRYTALPIPHKTARITQAGNAGIAQNFVNGRDLSGEWWGLFHSIQLNQLIEEGIRNNPSLAAAKAALTEARQLLRAQIGESYYPSIGLNLEAERTKISNVDIGLPVSNTFTVYTAQASATYLLDFFGKQRRLVESYRAQLYYARYEMLAAYLSLTSNIASNYINIASFQAQIKTTLKLIQDQTEILRLTKQQYQVGGASEENVITQETLLAQTKATLPPLQEELARTRHALSILVGKSPAYFMPADYNLNTLKLPRKLPVILPSELVCQRPDILASQALLHKASAEIGVATANLYPQITLTGNFGYISNTLSNFFSSMNNIWSYAAQLTQPIFEGGSLIAKKRAAVAAFQQSFAQYHETVLESFKQVSDALRSIQFGAKEFVDQYKAENSALRTLNITLKQFKVGGSNYLDVLNAQEQYQQNKLNRIKAQAARYSDTVLLFQALGGGWWNNNINMESLEIAGMARGVICKFYPCRRKLVKKTVLPMPQKTLPAPGAQLKRLPLPEETRA